MSPSNAPICGCSASGRILAWAMILPSISGGTLQVRGTRLFHLSDRSQQAMRTMARDIHEFAREERIEQLGFCKTDTGYGDEGLADELRIETMLQFIPGLALQVLDGHVVSDWARRIRPPLPGNCPRWPPTLAQVRAIEIAQYLDRGAP